MGWVRTQAARSAISAVRSPTEAGAPAATAVRARAAGPGAGGGAFGAPPSGMISSTPPTSTAAASATRTARFRTGAGPGGRAVRWAAAEADEPGRPACRVRILFGLSDLHGAHCASIRRAHRRPPARPGKGFTPMAPGARLRTWTIFSNGCARTSRRTPSSPTPTSPASYAHDMASFCAAGSPAVVVLPRTVEQVQHVMRTATALRVPVVPQGARTGLSGAANASEGCIVLSLVKMDRILEINPVDRVAVVEPGVVNAVLSRAVPNTGSTTRRTPPVGRCAPSAGTSAPRPAACAV